jgi:cytidylate kinase
VALDEGIPRRLLNDLGDPTRSLEAYGFHPRGEVTHDMAFTKVAQAILTLAGQGHSIIVGRGGAILCHGLANAFHFRLEAGLEWRVASIVRRLGVTREEAEKLVKLQTRQRDQFIKDALGADVGDRSYYDAVFNNERHSVDQIAAAITAFVLSAKG